MEKTSVIENLCTSITINNYMFSNYLIHIKIFHQLVVELNNN